MNKRVVAVLTINRTKALWIIFVNLKKKNKTQIIDKTSKHNKYWYWSVVIDIYNIQFMVKLLQTRRIKIHNNGGRAKHANKLAGVLLRQNMHHKRLEVILFGVWLDFRRTNAAVGSDVSHFFSPFFFPTFVNCSTTHAPVSIPYDFARHVFWR